MKPIQRYNLPRNDYQVAWNSAISAYSRIGRTAISPSMDDLDRANNKQEFRRGWNDALRALAREANKALGVSNDAAGGYLAPPEDINRRRGQKAAQQLTPPPGGQVLWQTAAIRYKNDRVLLDYGYRLSYEFSNIAQVKQFLAQGQKLGWHFLGKTLQVLDAYAREQQGGIPFGIDWQRTLAASKQETAKIATALHAHPPKTVTMRLDNGELPRGNGKPSMGVWADRTRLGSVAFKEEAIALAAIAKRLGAKVRSESPAGMMTISGAVGQTRAATVRVPLQKKALLPPLLPGGETLRGQSTISLDSVNGPFRWQLDYLVRKQYQFPDAQTAARFVAEARAKGYNVEGPAMTQYQTQAPIGGTIFQADMQVLRRAIPQLRTFGKGEELIFQRRGGDSFSVDRLDQGHETYWLTIRTRQGMIALRNAAQRQGISVSWK